ncbi:MAG TPA: response regulator [bacterium]|nr:response regulator [bacterium]
MTQIFLIKDIEELENQRALNNIKRLNQIIESRIENIVEKSADWSTWNEAYKFMDKYNQDFIDANFTKEVFINVKMNIIAFLKLDGSLHFGRYYDSNKRAVYEIPKSLQEIFIKLKAINQNFNANGFLKGIADSEYGPFMFSIKPVLTSEGRGPAKGLIIFGKIIDKTELLKFSKNLNMRVEFGEKIKKDIISGEKLNKFTLYDSFDIKKLKSDYLSCQLYKPCVFSKNNFIFEFEMIRDLYNYEINNISIIFIASLITLILIIILLYFLLSKLVVVRLSNLINNVKDVRDKNDLSLRVKGKGNDEISLLSIEINKMLDSLEEFEKNLEESRQWFQTIFETVQTGVLLIDKTEHRIIDANKSAIKMIGAEKDFITGQICHKFICPAEMGKCPVCDLGKEIDNSERILINMKGESVSILKTVITINLGGADYLLETFSDITKLKKTEEKLKLAKESAEEANIAKSRFLANMSHEIRTPLNSIIGFAEILSEEQLTAEQRDYVNLIYSSSETLMNLINDILDISKIEANKIELEEIEFDIDKIVFETIDIFRPRFNKKQIEFICNIDDVDNLLIGDPVRLKQILMNLLSNAIKFTEEGEIELKLTKKEENADTIRFEIIVKDTGIGIPEDKLELVFEPFKQVDSSTTRKYGGTGLGLNIVKKIIEYMSGTIRVESSVNTGSSFIINIPFRKSKNNLLNPVQYSDGLLGLEIACVDDNASNRTILENTLKKSGVIPLIFESGKQILEYLNSAEYTPKAAIIDIMMPDMDGFKVAAEIKNRFGDKIKLIGLSSNCSAFEKDELSSLLFEGFLNKPIKKLTLLNAIKLCVFGYDKEKGIITEQYVDNKYLNKKINILIAEDTLANRKFIDVLLKKMGLTGDFAENGKQACEMVDKKKYDMIFMDIQMPVMDGFEATKIIREKGADIPIIALTANAMKGDKEQCLEFGMNDYMTKPIKKEIFYQMLAKWTNIVPDYMKPQRILIIDENTVIINILKFAILDAYPDASIKTADSGLTGASMISGFMPDLVISSSSARGIDCAEFISLINSDKRFENISIVIYADAANKNIDSYKKLFDEHNAELLTPPFNKHKIIDAVNKVLRKKFFKKNDIIKLKDEINSFPAEPEDEAMLNRWFEIAGGDSDFEQIIIEFLLEIPETIDKLEYAIRQRDFTEIKKIAHSMKGSSGTLGASELYEQFLKIDSECKTGKNMSLIIDAFEEIKTIMNRIPKKMLKLKI